MIVRRFRVLDVTGIPNELTFVQLSVKPDLVIITLLSGHSLLVYDL